MIASSTPYNLCYITSVCVHRHTVPDGAHRCKRDATSSFDDFLQLTGEDRLDSVHNKGNTMAELYTLESNSHRDGSKPKISRVGKRRRKNGTFIYSTHAQLQGDEVGENSSSSCDGTLPRQQNLAQGWQDLSKEKMALLEIDSFKPLDFNETFLNKVKENDS